MNGNKQRRCRGLEVLAGIALAALAVSVLLTGCGHGLAADWSWTGGIGWR